MPTGTRWVAGMADVGVAIAAIAGAAVYLFRLLHASVWLVAARAGVAAVVLLAGILGGPRSLAWVAR